MPYRITSPHKRHSFYLLLAAGAVASFIAFGLVVSGALSHNSSTADRALLRAQSGQIAALSAKQAKDEAAQANYTASAVLWSLQRAVWTNCNDENQRHAATITELDNEVDWLKHHTGKSSLRRQLDASRQFTILLLDRLAPYQNCQQKVASLTYPSIGGSLSLFDQ